MKDFFFGLGILMGLFLMACSTDSVEFRPNTTFFHEIPMPLEPRSGDRPLSVHVRTLYQGPEQSELHLEYFPQPSSLDQSNGHLQFQKTKNDSGSVLELQVDTTVAIPYIEEMWTGEDAGSCWEEFRGFPVILKNVGTHPVVVGGSNWTWLRLECRDEDGKWVPLSFDPGIFCGVGFVYRVLLPGEIAVCSLPVWAEGLLRRLRVRHAFSGKKEVFSSEFLGKVPDRLLELGRKLRQKLPAL